MSKDRVITQLTTEQLAGLDELLEYRWNGKKNLKKHSRASLIREAVAQFIEDEAILPPRAVLVAEAVLSERVVDPDLPASHEAESGPLPAPLPLANKKLTTQQEEYEHTKEFYRLREVFAHKSVIVRTMRLVKTTPPDVFQAAVDDMDNPEQISHGLPGVNLWTKSDANYALACLTGAIRKRSRP